MRLPRVVDRVLTRAVARAKPAVPERAWPVLLSLRSLGGHGPLIAEPSYGSVAVLAAHPDDESLGCAGTLALLARRGCTIAVAFATDGDATRGASAPPHDTARRRRTEAAAACRILGTAEPSFWGLPDGGLAGAAPRLTERVRDFVSAAAPEAVLVPWFLDGHPDHEALSRAVAAASLGERVEVWAYETWTPLPANRLVDITRVWEVKRAAVAAHVTAHLAFDLDAALGLNRWRSIHGLMGRGYAEAFLAAPAPEYAALCGRYERAG